MRTRQRGFSAALVLTVLVLLGGMLTYAVTITSGMHSGIAQEITQARAQQAAHAGLEWARYRIRVPPVANCAAVTNLTIPLASGAMPVTVRCIATGPHPGAAPTTTYSLTANACLPAGPAGACPNPAGGSDYAERQVAGNSER